MSWAKRYCQFIYRRPLVVLALAAAALAPMLYLATKLDLRTDFKELLPSERRSVKEFDRIGAHVGSNASFSIGIEGDDLPAMKRFLADLTTRLRSFPPEVIAQVDESARAERDFFLRNRWLYAKYEDLERVRDALEERVIEQTPFDLGLDEEAPAGKEAKKPAPEPPKDDLKRLFEDLKRQANGLDRFPEGYYLGEEGHLLALYVYVRNGIDFDRARPLLAEVRRIIAEMNPASYHPSMRATVTGDLYTGIREYDALREDIAIISAICTTLVLAAILLFFGRLRSLAILGVTLLVGVGITFGFARLTIGYLNSSTAFLGSIVAGNGINFGVVMLARYFEERRRGSMVELALETAMRKTAAGTAGAALAASIAYGSLMLTDFRGFNQFGVIGGFGMVVCWLSAYTVGPAVIALCDRVPALARRSARPWRDHLSRPFVALIRTVPRGLVVGASLVSIAGVFMAFRFIARDPLEYDFGKLGNRERGNDYAAQLGHRIGRNIRSEGRDGVMILADRPDQVPLIVRALEAHKRAAGENTPLGDIVTVQSLLPDRQPEKLEILEHIRNVIHKVENKLDDEDRKLALEHVPPAELHPIKIEDLPKKVVEPFMERDGTVGRLVYVAPSPRMQMWNGKDIMRYASAVEKLELENGETIYTSGNVVVFADMLRSVLTEGPRAIGFSLGGVLLLVVLLMRSLRPSLVVLFTILCGTCVTVGIAAVVGLKLNFLNFVALPITVGIGADYAINMVQRYLDEPNLSPEEMVSTTGGAVILCSVTTVIGYSALLVAANRALVSFGILAALGEVTSLLLAVAFFPSLVRLLPPPAEQTDSEEEPSRAAIADQGRS